MPLQQTADDPTAMSLPDTIVRGYLVVTMLAALSGLLAQTLLPSVLQFNARLGLQLGFVALIAGCLVALRQRGAALHHALVGTALAGVLIVGMVAWLTGWGLRTGGLVFLPIGVMLACTLTTRRRGLLVAGCAIGMLALLAGAEWAGLAGLSALAPGAGLPPPPLATPPFSLPMPGVAPGPPLLQLLVLHLAAMAVAALAGLTLARLVKAHVHRAAEGEQRFRDLLGMAASAYWETDAGLRLTQLSRREGSTALSTFVPLAQAAGRPFWDIPAWTFDTDVIDRLRADMERRARLNNLAFTCRQADGSQRHCLASGEPRFDRGGRFVGYWGVARDITDERAAALALARSQALLSRVVSMSPDIITLSELETGRYVMVNHSFCRLLGHSAEQAQGRTAAELGLWHNPADRAHLLQSLGELGQVQDRLIPFVTRDGQLLPLLTSATRFDIDGQAYLLLNSRDMSEANRVRQEREAILAQALVGIAFTRQRRFVLVNALFEQMYGWPEGTLAGQPVSALWSDAAHFEALQQQVGPLLARGEAVDIERLGQRRDGSRFTVRLRAKAIDPANPVAGGTIWVAEDVSAARAAQAALAQARDAAEAANRAKSAFLANTSHELRTPLNGVLGLARLASQPGLDPQRLQRYLTQLGESAEQLAGILSDILDMAKIEAGKLQTEAAPFDLGGLLRSLGQLYSSLAAGRGLGFALQADPKVPAWVRGDALRLRQVLVNFLHNALKFCDSGAVLLVAQPLQQPEGWVRLEVHDTGPGIDAATQARLFEPFTQADTSTTRRWGGTGLGLSICRELATLMGGRVGLRSAPGQGSCFYLELPLPVLPAPQAPPGRDADDQRLASAQVLLVEDNSVNLLVGTALLEQWGVEVTTATDGAQALAAVALADAQGRLFDLVLMDLQMPGMGGLEATQRLRQRYSAELLPIVALTAAALVSERERAKATGMTDFLTKPIDPDQLRDALLRALPRSLSRA